METSFSRPTILPQSEHPPTYGPVRTKEAPPAPPRPSKKPLLILIVAVVVLIAGSLIIITKQTQSPSEPVTTPTPTVAAVPTQTRELSAIATQSAFMEFQSSVEAMPAAVQNAVLDDQAMAPPVIALPLGFPNEE
jgi:cytoskeletal protein RodZ